MAQAEETPSPSVSGLPLAPDFDVDAVLKDAIGNLEGSLDKLNDAAAGRYGQTWDRAGTDVRQVLPYLIRRLREVREAVRAT